MKIAIITALATFIANTVFHFFKNQFDWFTDRKKFKREHAYKQLTELYFEIYGIVIQSEYFRFFYSHYKNESIKMSEVPFFEIGIKQENTKKNLFTGEVIEKIEKIVKNGITSYKKELITEKIISNSKYASSKLLKLAIAHRYCESNYQKEFDDAELTKQFRDQELILIKEIVQSIVSETNELLELCHMDFDESEKNDGIINEKVFKKHM